MLKTKRWNDPVEASDGRRLLVTRYRPRGVGREQETWDAWLPHLGPSRELHAAAYGKGQPAIAWLDYAARYLNEMAAQRFWIDALAQQHARGEVLTLLCSSACVDAAQCHRSLLAGLIAAERAPERELPATQRVVRRKRDY